MSLIFEDWAENADYDIETAKAMLDARRYIYVLFLCQQAFEKLFKAIIVQQTGQLPPYIHSLNRLVEVAQVNTTKPKPCG